MANSGAVVPVVHIFLLFFTFVFFHQTLHFFKISCTFYFHVVINFFPSFTILIAVYARLLQVSESVSQ
jgi:hypothetical protein